MMDKQNSIRSRRSPHHRNKHLHSWNPGIAAVIKYMKKKRGVFLKRSKVFQVIELFFELSFKAQMHGYKNTWPHAQRGFGLTLVKQTGAKKIQKHMATQKIVYPDNYLRLEFIIEPRGDRFFNYGYNFVPDLEVRKASVDFINKNPEIAEKLIP